MAWTPPTHDPAVELRDHLLVEAWREPIAAIADRHGLAVTELAPFDTGSDIVWSAGGSVVKLTAPLWADEIEAEASALERVAGRLSVATPEVAAVGELAGWPYVVMSHVPGVPIGELWRDLDAAERRRLAGDLGRLTRELNELGSEEEAGDWPEFWARCTSEVGARHAKRGGPPELAEQIDAFLEGLGPLVPRGFGFLHTELLDQHVLAREVGGAIRLCGLIDFADSRVGPVDYEFPAPVDFIFKGEPGALRAYFLEYGEDPAELDGARELELCAWSLCHRFGSLPRMVAALGGEAPRSIEELARRLFSLSGS